ncbi:MAG: isoprenyl transferase [Alphaproteobacteria bacterium]|nr:isoprenyl transferase [Alphaproteobacteria bacterium]
MSGHPFQIPRHIAIIMDGNGRWAEQRGLPRTAGHHQGVEACKRVVRSAGELNIPFITLFGFSSENWRRPADEINELMRLLRMFLRAETAELHRNNIRLKMIGSREGLSPDIVQMIESAEQLMAGNTGLTLTIALNYGGRHEILTAAASYARQVVDKGLTPGYETAEEFFPTFLMTHGMPDPDVIIRPSGEQRISNFLLWQCAYSEFVFTNTLWPDFGKSDLEYAMAEYAKRERRFGAVQHA